MRRHNLLRHTCSGLALLLSIGIIAACGDDDVVETGPGGSTSEGGTGGTGATAGSGGTGAVGATGGTGGAGGTADTGGAGGAGGAGEAGGAGGAGGSGPNCLSIEDEITAQALDAHLAALQQIAANNDGNRAAGSAGWDASVTYVTNQLEGAGYTVTTMPVEHPYYDVLGDPALGEVSPTAQTYVFGDGSDSSHQFQGVLGSPPGDVTADLEAVDLDLGLGNTSSSGCESSDFTGFTSGSIALLQRGTCPFVVKAQNAQAAGATGVILFNQGDTEDRKGLMPGGLHILPDSPDHGLTIPVVFTTYDVADALVTELGSSTVSMHLMVDTIWEIRNTHNVLAETASGDANEVVMLGGHLDSVPDGPGINDNGTGVAAMLEIAKAVASCPVSRKLRFAFWTAEEMNLWGSGTYVFGPNAPDLTTIHMYLNLDVLGSPNAVNFIYDGDGSDFGAAGPAGSAEIEQWFEADLLFAGLSSEPIWSDRSDHFLFHLGGVPYGGLFTGAEALKTTEEAAVFGGTAGDPYDPCCHASCDTPSNVDSDTLETMSKSLARAVQYFGIDGETVPPSP